MPYRKKLTSFEACSFSKTLIFFLFSVWMWWIHTRDFLLRVKKLLLGRSWTISIPLLSVSEERFVLLVKIYSILSFNYYPFLIKFAIFGLVHQLILGRSLVHWSQSSLGVILGSRTDKRSNFQCDYTRYLHQRVKKVIELHFSFFNFFMSGLAMWLICF